MTKKYRTDEDLRRAFNILKDKVDKEEKRAIRLKNQLENQLNVLVKSRVIDDYNLHFGYTMHCICFHNHLSFEEILTIDDVWIEIKAAELSVTSKK